MTKLRPYLVLLLLLTACFSVAAILAQRMPQWNTRATSDNVLNILLGDGRRLFANHFFIQADVSYHSGYYPSIFDQARAQPRDTRHLTTKEEDPEHAHDQEHNKAEEEHEKQMAFLGPPRDWIERFGRHFIITQHTHLEGHSEREILPWLKLSSQLDPQKVETYTVSAFWLRDMGKVKEAEDFLREGLRNNPDSYEILFELGRLYNENYHDTARARNVWELGLHKWAEQEAAGKKPDLMQLDQLAVGLARLEEKEGHYSRAIEMLTLAKKGTPHPEVLQQQIDELKQKVHPTPASGSAAPR